MSQPGRERLQPAIGWLLLSLALGVGLYARLSGFGERPLAVDEFYFFSSLQAILRNGVPELLGGGLYLRGVVPQYLSAGVVAAFGENPGAARLVPLLCNLASVPVLYLYGRRLLGPLAWLPPTLLLVSSWEIEFSRFARMYAPFQLATLLLLLSVDRAFFERSWRRYWPHFFAALALLCHSLGLLLLPLLLLPLALRGTEGGFDRFPERARYLLVTILVLLACVLFDQLGPGRGGFPNAFPADYEKTRFPLLRLPDFPFWGVGKAQTSLFFAIGLGLVASGVAAAVQFLRRREVAPAALIAGALAAATFHQFVPAAVLAFVVVVRYARPLGADVPALTSRAWLALAVVGIVMTGWLGTGLLREDWWEAGSRMGAMRRAFFAWPDYFSPVVDPWIRELPDVGLLVGLAVAFQLVTRLRRPLPELLGNPALVILYVATAFGALATDYTTTRYAFFVYPLGLCCVVLSTSDLFSWFTDWPLARRALATTAVVGLAFAATSDFQPAHWAGIRSDDVVYRRAAFASFEGVWYPRRDFVTPAQEVEAAATSDDPVIVVAQPPVSHYLQREHAIFYARSDPRFGNVSRQRGTIDRWTGMRLLSTSDEVRAYTERADRVWIVQGAAPDEQFFDPAQIWSDRPPHVTRRGTGVDGRVEVILVEFAGSE